MNTKAPTPPNSQRIVLLSAATRSTGFTRELEDDFISGACAAKGQLELLRLSERHIAECRGCYGCWHPAGGHRCVIAGDDMPALMDSLLRADAVVFSTPLYFFSFASSLKRFLERLLPLTEAGAARGPCSGLTMNTPSARLRRRPAVLLCTAAHRDLRVFDGVRRSFELVADALNLEPSGELLRPESFLLDFSASHPSLHRRVHNAFVDAGQQLVTEGRILARTEQEARSPLTASQELFDSHFATYWTIAKERGLDPARRRELREIAGRDMRILMPELASSYDPSAGGDLCASIGFDLEGSEPRHYLLRIAHGKCTVAPEEASTADLIICASAELMADILLQRADIRAAYADKRLTVKGDRSLFTRLGRLFLSNRQ